VTGIYKCPFHYQIQPSNFSTRELVFIKFDINHRAITDPIFYFLTLYCKYHLSGYANFWSGTKIDFNIWPWLLCGRFKKKNMQFLFRKFLVSCKTVPHLTVLSSRMWCNVARSLQAFRNNVLLPLAGSKMEAVRFSEMLGTLLPDHAALHDRWYTHHGHCCENHKICI
jgi:hypothetical protein